jgi:predicted dehydrogenase
VLIGAGQRGIVYSNYALDHPELLSIVAVAEPHPGRRQAVAAKFNLKPEVQFASWNELLEARSVWDVPAETANGAGEAAPTAASLSAAKPIALIATPDALHVAPSVAFSRAGFHVLLEKPMAVQPEQCDAIAAAATEADAQSQKDQGCPTIFAVCHVLRYTPINTAIRDLIRSGRLGQVLSIQHLEPVGAAHFAHSYVRGNWSRKDHATFSLMAKSCHDIDLLQFWMQSQPRLGVDAGATTPGSVGGDNPAVSVSSFGNLLHFNPTNKPANASSRCLDCAAEATCPYSGQKIYLKPLTEGKEKYEGWYPNFQALVDEKVPDIENVTAALRDGPYGRCVYDGQNDVADQQVVNLQFAQGQTASFSMVSTTQRVCERHTRVFGSKGQVETEDGERIVLHEFATNKRTVFHPLLHGGLSAAELAGTESDAAAEDLKAPQVDVGRLTGHNGADFYLMREFVHAVRSARPELVSSGPAQSLASHRIVFAAEKARLSNTVVSLNHASAKGAAPAAAAVAPAS